MRRPDQQEDGPIHSLIKLDFNAHPDGRARAEAVAAHMLEYLGGLEQAGHIERSAMEDWTEEAVESVMAAVARSWRIPDPAGNPGSSRPSAWDGPGYNQWHEVVGILSDEIAALTMFTPAEIGRFCSPGPDGAWHLQRAVQEKLLRVQGSASWPGKWRSLRRRLFMKYSWQGGTGLNPNAGWMDCNTATGRLARHLEAHPGASWLPGLLREPSSFGHGRLALVEYLYPGRKHAGRAAAGIIPDEAVLRLSIQFMHCVRAGQRPSTVGFCIFDQEEHLWHFREVTPSIENAIQAEKRAREAWREHVLTGRAPPAGVPTARQRVGPPPAAESETLATAWIAAMVVAASREHETRARGALEELLRRQLPPAGRTARTRALSDLCHAELNRTCSAGDLEGLGFDPDEFRAASDTACAASLLAAIEHIRVQLATKVEKKEIWDAIGRLLDKPPTEAGPIDPDKAMKALGERVSELAGTSLQLKTDDRKRREVIQGRIGLALEAIISDAAVGLVPDLRDAPADGGGASAAAPAAS